METLLNPKQKENIKNAINQSIEHLEDNLNFALAEILDNEVGISRGKKSWFTAMDYARELFFKEKIKK